MHVRRAVILLLLGVLILGVIACTPASLFPTPMYIITISSGVGGKVSAPGEGAFRYAKGTVVTLVATPDPGYRFTNWATNADTIGNVYAASTTITVNNYYFVIARFDD